MKRFLEAFVAITLFLGIFVGGLFAIIYLTSPPPRVPYKGATMPAGAHVVTSRSWFQPTLFSLETYDAFQRRPVALKWLAAGPSGIKLEAEAPILGSSLALILIHGYNAPESKVGSYFSGVLDLLRGAIGQNAAMIIYDWPSTARHWEELTTDERRAQIDPGGGPRDMRNPWAPMSHEAREYRADQAAARRHGADGLVELLRLLTRDKPRPIAILAHSMGALVTVEALRRMPPGVPTIDTVVLLAPDLPADELGTRGTAEALGRISAVHVMHSRRHEALWYSELANKGKRLGRDGHLGSGPLPAHVTLHDVTDNLGGEGIAVHGRYLEREGAEAIGLTRAVADGAR